MELKKLFSGGERSLQVMHRQGKMGEIFVGGLRLAVSKRDGMSFGKMCGLRGSHLKEMFSGLFILLLIRFQNLP